MNKVIPISDFMVERERLHEEQAAGAKTLAAMLASALVGLAMWALIIWGIVSLF